MTLKKKDYRTEEHIKEEKQKKEGASFNSFLSLCLCVFYSSNTAYCASFVSSIPNWISSVDSMICG